jgi:hypothetical protein
LVLEPVQILFSIILRVLSEDVFLFL